MWAVGWGDLPIVLVYFAHIESKQVSMPTVSYELGPPETNSGGRLITSMSTQADIDWDAVAGLRASTYRRRTAEALEDGPKYAAEVAEEIGTSQGVVSNQFRWLKYNNPPLVECLTPDRPHHRLYQLTPAGKRVVNQA